MTDELESLELRSLIPSSGELRLSLKPIRLSPPNSDEIVVQVEAAPISPSDMGLLFSPADPGTMEVAGSPVRPVLTMRVVDSTTTDFEERLGDAMAQTGATLAFDPIGGGRLAGQYSQEWRQRFSGGRIGRAIDMDQAC